MRENISAHAPCFEKRFFCGLIINDKEALRALNVNASIWSPVYQYPILHSWAIEDGSFLRLKTLQLSYTLPKKFTRKIHLNQVQVFIAGQNLWTWTSYSGLDPEVSTRNSALTPNFDYSAYARNRIYTAGIKVTF